MADEASPVRKTTRAVGAALRAPLTVRERLNRGLLPVAFVGGVLGLAGLALCGVLWLLPEERWPEALDRDGLPFCTMLSLLCASLLGWGCMQKGLSRMRRAVGWTLGGWLFVGLPLLCAAFVLAAEGGVLGEVEERAWLRFALRFAHAYPPTLVALALVAYVTARSRLREQGRFERGVWFSILVAPYALLMVYLVLGLDVPWLGEGLNETIQGLGSGAIVAQVALAYFCGGGGGSTSG